MVDSHVEFISIFATDSLDLNHQGGKSKKSISYQKLYPPRIQLSNCSLPTSDYTILNNPDKIVSLVQHPLIGIPYLMIDVNFSKVAYSSEKEKINLDHYP